MSECFAPTPHLSFWLSVYFFTDSLETRFSLQYHVGFHGGPHDLQENGYEQYCQKTSAATRCKIECL
jgi:hypothetical protein